MLVQVLHACSRPKIFKNPGSFSYKRLLPYLMQAADGNSLVLFPISGFCAEFDLRKLEFDMLNSLSIDGTSSSSRCSKPEKSIGQNPPNINLSSNQETEETADDVMEEVSNLMTAKCQLPETTKPVLQSVDRVFNKDSARSFCRNSSPLKRVIASSPNKKAVRFDQC